jgi:hypothetical protein
MSSLSLLSFVYVLSLILSTQSFVCHNGHLLAIFSFNILSGMLLSSMEITASLISPIS